MLEGTCGGIRFRLSLLFPALVTTLLLCQPDGLAVSCLAASAIHEGGHLLAMLALGVPPTCCTIGAFGVRIRLGERLLSYRQNWIISAAGPLANLLVAGLLFCLGCPTAGTVHLILAGFNLLPAAALDGGELLRYGLCLLGFASLADTVLRFTSALVLLPLATVSFLLFLLGWGNGTLAIVSVYLVLLVFFGEKGYAGKD